LTSLLDPKQYPAEEIVALYHERWETELAYDEVKDAHAGSAGVDSLQDA
jgi:hypothetical protein